MSKIKKAFFCQNCGASYAQWKGFCTACKQWNTLVEEVYQKESNNALTIKDLTSKALPISIDEITLLEQGERTTTHDEELNRSLGGGIVPGSIILVAGEPGIGKSTLFLQLALQLKNKKVLYVSGEESQNQIKLRADRLKAKNSDCLILIETSTSHILKKASELTPSLIIIDSIQTLESSLIDSLAGSVSQIRQCTSELIAFAKKTAIPIILIGHITKEGSIAGPKILEHMVDVVLQFEGDTQHIYRLLRTKKNRFGSTSELGICQMNQSGLHQVKDPSQILLYSKENQLSGHSIAAAIEGQRPILIEVQALISDAIYAIPQRSPTGFDLKRLHMLLAVLEKRAGFLIKNKDVFINLTGGLKIQEPAIDLAVLASIISSFKDMALGHKICFCAEVGLSGEIRPVYQIENRIAEASKLGFEKIVISSYHRELSRDSNIELIEISSINELIKKIL